MVSKCANPSCAATFDHREGRLFRFPKRPIEGSRPANTHAVQHFWLCGSCIQDYQLEYHDGVGVTIAPHFETTPVPGPRTFIAAA
jgi:hypothetical protein